MHAKARITHMGAVVMEKQFFAFADEYTDRFQALVAEIYETLGPTIELSSRATFVLLSSLTLLGLSLASSKPDSVQVLGFTIQASHWLYLALPLALVVLYAMTQLSVAWRVEWSRLRYVMVPRQKALSRLMHELQARNADEMEVFFKEQDRVRDARNAIAAWYTAERLRISKARRELLFDPDGYVDSHLEDKIATLSSDEAQLEGERRRKLEDAGVTQHDRITDGILELLAAGKDSPLVELAKEYLRNIDRIFTMRRRLAWLGLIIPLLVAFFSILTLIYMAWVAPGQ